MSNAPAHIKEHNDLMFLLAKLTCKSDLIVTTILITIGVDGRPCVGSDIKGGPVAISRILREIGAAEKDIANVSRMPVPKDN